MTHLSINVFIPLALAPAHSPVLLAAPATKEVGEAEVSKQKGAWGKGQPHSTRVIKDPTTQLELAIDLMSYTCFVYPIGCSLEGYPSINQPTIKAIYESGFGVAPLQLEILFPRTRKTL